MRFIFDDRIRSVISNNKMYIFSLTSLMHNESARSMRIHMNIISLPRRYNYFPIFCTDLLKFRKEIQTFK